MLDDNSPDGTGEVADALAAADPQVHVLHRAGKEGLGAAYLAGFGWALDAGYDAVVEMDADGSHRPEHLPAMLAAAEHADAVIGSRWVRGGSVVNWPLHRKALSVGGNLYVKVLLGMPVNDATAGYRVYRVEALRAMGLDDVESLGYCFQTDLTWRAVKARPDRRRGADHLRRARGRRLQDEPRHHEGVAAPDHRLGRAPPRPPGARAGRGHPRAEVAHAVSRTGATPYASRRRRPRVLRWVFLALLIVPVVEIAAIIAVGRVIGGWQTLLLLVLESLLGAWIVKREGVTHLGRPAGGAAQRADAEPSALRRGPGAHRRHPAAHPGVRHRHRRLLLHPAADPPDHPDLARDRRRPPAARPDGGVAHRSGPGPAPGTGRRTGIRAVPAAPRSSGGGPTSSRVRSSTASRDDARTDAGHPRGVPGTGWSVRRTCACGGARRATRAGG